MRQTKNSNKNWSWTLFPQTILWWVEVKTCHFHLHLVVTQNDWAWYEDSTSQGSQKSVIPYHFPSFPICYTTPTIEITSRALGSQTLFCWHLSRGWCSTWFPDWPNLAGKIWVKCSWTLFGGGFWRWLVWGRKCLGGSCVQKIYGAYGCISRSLEFWKAWCPIHSQKDVHLHHLPISPAYQSWPQVVPVSPLSVSGWIAISHRPGIPRKKRNDQNHFPKPNLYKTDKTLQTSSPVVPPKQIYTSCQHLNINDLEADCHG